MSVEATAPTSTNNITRDPRAAGGTMASTIILNGAIDAYVKHGDFPIPPEFVGYLYTLGNLANLAIGTAMRDIKFVLDASEHRDKVWMHVVMAPINFVASIFG